MNDLIRRFTASSVSDSRLDDQADSTVLAIFWVLALSALAVGARNFEVGGIGVDGTLYAHMARTAARSGEWWFLRGTHADFIPFVEHPHLGIWFLATVFSFFPADDWSGRIVGHLFYVSFLLGFFFFLRWIDGLKTAVLSTFLLFLFFRFANFFSNIYLDPGCVFFGCGALFLVEAYWRLRRPSLAFLAGCFLSLSFLYKGLTVLGFLPGVAVVYILCALRDGDLRRALNGAGFLALGAALVLGTYQLALSFTNVPDFLSHYYRKQWTERFRVFWDWRRILSSRIWLAFLSDTSRLAPFALLGLWYGRAKPIVWAAATVIVTFILMYAPTDRVGAQYQVPYLPWFALLIAQVPLIRWLVRSPMRWMKVTSVLAMLTLFLFQYVPMRTHGREPAGVSLIRRLVHDGKVQKMVIDFAPRNFDFTYKDHFYWYADVPFEHTAGNDSPALAKKGVGLVLMFPSDQRRVQLKETGWCPVEDFGDRAVWLPCVSM